ncbi:hypothetical protein K5M36_21430 [Chromobacterium vaccinii]|nr:hypothetical protein [Chromobacterium vaccinii]
MLQSENDFDKQLFELLASRGLAAAWLVDSPQAALETECRQLIVDLTFQSDLADYLSANPVISESIETVLAQLAFSAGVHWRQAEKVLQPLAYRGWHLARWLPTFLLVDGPLGRLLRQSPSPLAKKLKSHHANFPLLASARDAFNNDLFRKVRNGFAHWSFTWNGTSSPVQIEVFHFESGCKEATLSLLEAEALHYLVVSVIRAINEELLRKASTSGA